MTAQQHFAGRAAKQLLRREAQQIGLIHKNDRADQGVQKRGVSSKESSDDCRHHHPVHHNPPPSVVSMGTHDAVAIKMPSWVDVAVRLISG